MGKIGMQLESNLTVRLMSSVDLWNAITMAGIAGK